MTSWLNTWRCGPGGHTCVMDEIEVGAQAAKLWASGNVGVPTVPGAEHRIRAMPPRAVHYVPPAQYVRIQAEQKARDAARAAPPQAEPATPPPFGQLDLFSPTTPFEG